MSRSLSAVALLVCAAVLVAAQNPAPPIIPLQWQGGMVQVFFNASSPQGPIEFGGHMYWDYTVDSIRQDFSISGGSFVQITQYGAQTIYDIQIGTWANNQPACVKGDSMGSMANRYVFQNATYSGKMSQSGVMCDVWWIIIQNPAPQPATNLTIWWNTALGIPVEWTNAAVDGSTFGVVSLFSVQTNVNVPGNGLFAIPPLCNSADAEDYNGHAHARRPNLMW